MPTSQTKRWLSLQRRLEDYLHWTAEAERARQEQDERLRRYALLQQQKAVDRLCRTLRSLKVTLGGARSVQDIAALLPSRTTLLP